MKNFLKIKFIPTYPRYDDLTVPEPASRHVPEWYVSLAKYESSNSEKRLFPKNAVGTDAAAVFTKMCPPFLDALTAGYVYVLEDDLHVELDEEGKPKLSWGIDRLLVDKRPKIDLPVPDNCHPIHFGWRMNW